MKNSNTFYSWSTKKVLNGFEGIATKNVSRDTVNENGRYVDSMEVRCDLFHSRAVAKRAAQKWCKYLRSQNN